MNWRPATPLEKVEQSVEPTDAAKTSSIRKEGLARTPGVPDDGLLKSLTEANAVMPVHSIVTPAAVPLRTVHQYEVGIDAYTPETERLPHTQLVATFLWKLKRTQQCAKL
jgi:hypothetical protein